MECVEFHSGSGLSFAFVNFLLTFKKILKYINVKIISGDIITLLGIE